MTWQKEFTCITVAVKKFKAGNSNVSTALSLCHCLSFVALIEIIAQWRSQENFSTVHDGADFPLAGWPLHSYTETYLPWACRNNRVVQDKWSIRFPLSFDNCLFGRQKHLSLCLASWISIGTLCKWAVLKIGQLPLPTMTFFPQKRSNSILNYLPINVVIGQKWTKELTISRLLI